ncbi:hypothetical protein DRP04_05700 [Archaeoglobales archaeon]|nr:MAG: hypothetical protein DRP04_05700 [Archaeoglobales archaeon]
MRSDEITYQEARKHLRKAKDTYGKNTIEKKQVDVPYEERLIYEPHCPIVTFIQPLPIPEERIMEGDLRRDIIPFVRMGGIDRTKDYEDKVFSRTEKGKEEALEDFIAFLQTLEQLKISDFEFAENAKRKLVEYHRMLVEFGKNCNEKTCELFSPR